jgi:Tol biopolymer transport system component
MPVGQRYGSLASLGSPPDRAVRRPLAVLGALRSASRSEESAETMSCRAQGEVSPSKFNPDMGRSLLSGGGNVRNLERQQGLEMALSRQAGLVALMEFGAKIVYQRMLMRIPKPIKIWMPRRHAQSRWRLLALTCASILSAAAPAMSQPDSACTLDRTTGTTIDPQPFLANAWGSRWNVATDRIAFTQPDAANRYRLFTIRPDRSDRRPLAPDLPGHQGAPYWHPSGRYVLFIVEKRGWSGRRLFGIPDYEALPGFGRHDDLWIAAIDGQGAWQLTHDLDTCDQGVLVPIFSPDGKRVAWSARQPGGKYVMKVADFVETPEPHLADIRAYQPGGAAYYETGSFASDGQSLLYTSDQDSHSFWRSQIYRLDLATGAATQLTPGNDYNEHPTVVPTPHGDWVVHMSTKGVNRYPFHLMLGTDWYAMQLDGAGVKRLTEMNVNRPGNLENTGHMQVAGTVAISPSGRFMLGDVQDNLIKQTGSIELVRFICP